MSMGTKTTDTKARKFVAISRRSRPATGGNKNVNAKADRQGSGSSQVPTAQIGRSLKGPDLGDG